MMIFWGSVASLLTLRTAIITRFPRTWFAGLHNESRPRIPSSSTFSTRQKPTDSKKLHSLTARVLLPPSPYSSVFGTRKRVTWSVGDDTDVPGRVDSSGYLLLFAARPDISVAHLIRVTCLPCYLRDPPVSGFSLDHL